MKKINILFWIFNGLLALAMLTSAIPNLISSAQWVEIFKSLGYPAYLLPFLGVAKLLGIIAIVVPGFPRLKEWAYAGFAFDIIGALYSCIAVGTPLTDLWVFVIYLAVLALSYIYYHKKISAKPL